MISRSQEEIVAECERLWPKAAPYHWHGRTPAIQVAQEGSRVRLTIGAMYDWGDDTPKPDLAKRLELSKFFDTMMVELADEFNEGGCDTCDYGGAHGFVLVVSPGAPYDDAVRVAIEKLP
jgi:hypothetical protein